MYHRFINFLQNHTGLLPTAVELSPPPPPPSHLLFAYFFLERLEGRSCAQIGRELQSQAVACSRRKEEDSEHISLTSLHTLTLDDLETEDVAAGAAVEPSLPGIATPFSSFFLASFADSISLRISSFCSLRIFSFCSFRLCCLSRSSCSFSSLISSLSIPVLGSSD